MHASTVAQCLRVTAALLGLAVTTTCQLLDDLADRVDPPPLDYAGFDDGYFVPTPRGRA